MQHLYNERVILPTTRQLLEALFSDETLSDFVLVGGTALALQIGHRLSIDLDLFTLQSIDTVFLAEHLEQTYSFSTDFVARNTLKGVISGVKCDFITHSYPFVVPIQIENRIRFASLLDIAAMKLNAIAHNGTRYKDFVDIYYLLGYHSLSECLNAFSIKYPKTNTIVALKGIGYFEDIDFNIDPPLLFQDLSFEILQARMLSALKEPHRIF